MTAGHKPRHQRLPPVGAGQRCVPDLAAGPAGDAKGAWGWAGRGCLVPLLLASAAQCKPLVTTQGHTSDVAVVSNSSSSSFPLQGGSALRLDFSALLGPLFFTCEWGWLNAFCTCQALVALCPRLRSFDRPLHATLHSATRLCLSVGPAVLSHCSRLPVVPPPSCLQGCSSCCCRSCCSTWCMRRSGGCARS